MDNFRLNMTWYFPLAITSVAQARISIQKIEVSLYKADFTQEIIINLDF